MRLDEFSAPSQIDGTISSIEQARFLLFGFDVSPRVEGVTYFCDIANPSELVETDKSFRIKSTSASGHTRLRPVGRQKKKEFGLKWKAMSATDKATLQAFFDENIAAEFRWTHPLTGVVYVVYFADNDLAFSHVKGSVNRWEASLTLGEA